MPATPLTVTDAAGRLRRGDLTSVELTSTMIERADVLDPRLGTYVTRFDESALAAAEQADRDFAAGIDKGPYQGIPIGMKDILAMSEGPTTANSLILDRAWGAGRDAPVVARLKAAGAVITGKTTTSEFAIGLPDPTKPFAIPHNPWDLDRTPAGSSAGTANGIAAGLFLAGIGTDTGGSIRSPASMNGITGLKPTFGRVPKSGCVPLAYSLDHIGPMARSARDCAAMLSIIAGYHPSDHSCADRPVAEYESGLDGSLEGVRVGVARQHHFPEDADPQLRATFEEAVSVLERLGATTVEVSLPYFDAMRTGQVVTMVSEALAYHRGDLQTRWGDYYAGTRLNMAFGALFGSMDYVQAQRVRRLALRELADLYTSVDVIVTPTSPNAAALISEMAGTVVTRLLKASFTSYWNMTGQPTLALPMGFNATGLPLSLQIAGRPFDEALVLKAGDAYQRATGWHLEVPPIAATASIAA